MLIIKAALPEFKKRGGGTVVNIGSVNGLAGGCESAGLFDFEGWNGDDDAQSGELTGDATDSS